MRKHLVISGTGRSGTSFLVQLLTELALETGYSSNSLALHDVARAGLEHDIRSPECPYIAKDPNFCDYAEDILADDNISIDCVIVPVRDIKAVAESRRHVHHKSLEKLPLTSRIATYFGLKGARFAGGLWYPSGKSKRADFGKQEEIVSAMLAKLILSLSKTDIPIIFLHYPTLAKDPQYLLNKLQPIMSQHNIDEETFIAAFKKVVRPDWVHSFSASDQ